MADEFERVEEVKKDDGVTLNQHQLYAEALNQMVKNRDDIRFSLADTAARLDNLLASARVDENFLGKHPDHYMRVKGELTEDGAR